MEGDHEHGDGNWNYLHRSMRKPGDQYLPSGAEGRERTDPHVLLASPM